MIKDIKRVIGCFTICSGLPIFWGSLEKIVLSAEKMHDKVFKNGFFWIEIINIQNKW